MTKASELLYIEDFDAVVALGQLMQLECEPSIPYNELEVRANLFMCVNDLQREAINMWIVKDNDRIVGFGVGQISKFLFSHATKASLTLWFVLPEYRKTRAAFEILHNFENWARLQSVIRTEVGVAKCNVDEAKHLNQMFTKRGFTRYGELFYR